MKKACKTVLIVLVVLLVIGAAVGGWTLEMFGGFPHAGDSFRHENMTVTVLSMVDGRRVGKVLVQVDPAETEE